MSEKYRDRLFMINGDRCEVVLTPTTKEISQMIDASMKLMAIKKNAWILDQLTVEQLKTCIEQFQAELNDRLASDGANKKIGE